MATRVNISLPDHLKGRMKAATHPINWSAVAAQAFSSHLDRISAKPAVCPALLNDMTETIVAAGEHSGRDWAGRLSTPPELRRLEESHGPAGTWEWAKAGDFAAGEQFFFVIEPESHGRTDFAADFWGLFLASGVRPHPVFVHAFASAAMKLREETKMMSHNP